MFLPHKIILGALLLTMTIFLHGSENDLRELYAWTQMRQKLTPEQLHSINRRQITPHQAARQLRTAGNFEHYSATFAPYLHALYYRLGQLTADPQAAWSDETAMVCIALERYLALFQMLNDYPAPPGESLTLLAPSQAGTIPESDCMPYNGVLTASPRWQAVPGQKFCGTFIALPRRSLPEVQFRLPEPNAAERSNPPLKIRLQKISYQYRSGSWQASAEPVPAVSSLDHGMQVYQLQTDLPADIQPGIYQGEILMFTRWQNRPARLNYTLYVTTPANPTGE